MRCPYRLGRPYIWPKVENNGVFVFACVRFRLCAFSSVCVMGCVRFGSQNCVRFRLCALSSVFVFASVRFFHLPYGIYRLLHTFLIIAFDFMSPFSKMWILHCYWLQNGDDRSPDSSL